MKLSQVSLMNQMVEMNVRYQLVMMYLPFNQVFQNEYVFFLNI